MIRNYLKIAWRNLWSNKFFSSINILGLGLGMGCSILIMLWVQNELGMDAFHKNSRRLYIVMERQYYDGKAHGQYAVPGVLANQLKKTMPDVEYATNWGFDNDNTFRVGDKILKLTGNSADSDFFKMFSYPLLKGDARTALNSPVSIAISRKMAVDFFGSPDAAMGRSILYNNKKSFKVTAVFEDVPHNSSLQFEYLINWQSFLTDNNWATSWGNNGPHAYVMLREGADGAAVDKKITRFLDNLNKEQDKSFREELGLQKVSDAYLNSHFSDSDGKPDGGRIENVHLFSIVALFIMLIACINFMNLTTARSVKRSREIGVRKVVGAVRPVLIRQFLGEAVLLTSIAMIIALILVIVLLPVFNTITQKQIAYPFADYWFWIGLVLLTLITGVISGSYPALFLSSFKPVTVLKGTLKLSPGSAWFRKGLVVVQFMLSVVLVIGTIVVSKQVNYIQNKNIGFDRENLIFVPVEGDLPKNYKAFKQEALLSPGIQDVSKISDSPTHFDSTTGGVQWEGKTPNLNIEFTQIMAGYDFVKTMKLKMAEGRDFQPDYVTDSVGYIINEAALKRIGYKDPINKPLTMWGRKGKIIGVLKDFHFASMHESIQPLIVRLGDTIHYGYILIRTQPGQTRQALGTIEKLCKQLNPNFTFTYYFTDKDYQKLFNDEQVVGSLSKAFAFLGIFISCLGLLGLAMFTAEQRVKEIGIRKVLGATVPALFALLSKEFIILVSIALVVASPFAWWIMHHWLQSYQYRTPIDWWVFALAAVLSVLIALVTVSFQSAKAALMNPVKSLRSE